MKHLGKLLIGLVILGLSGLSFAAKTPQSCSYKCTKPCHGRECFARDRQLECKGCSQNRTGQPDTATSRQP